MGNTHITRRTFINTTAKGIGVLGVSPLLNRVYRKSGTGYIYDDRMLDHIISPGHVECPERLLKITEMMEATGLDQEVTNLPLFDDPYPYIKKVHTDSHIASVRKIPDTCDAAEIAVAGALGAAKAVCEGSVKNAFCAIRPPGHHAHNSGEEEGFCYYNNVSIAAKYVQEVFSVEKVAIIDWDFHHGNATQDTFYSDPSVLFFSTHEQFAYPGTGDPAKVGSGDGYGLNINYHLDPGSKDDDIKRAWDEKFLPKVQTFKPDMVFISAGFDSRIDDIKGTFDITDDCFAYLTKLALEIAGTYSNGKLVSLLEGGYNIDGTASATTTHVAELVKDQTGVYFGEKRDKPSGTYIRKGICYLPLSPERVTSITINNAAGRLCKTISPSLLCNGAIDLNKVGLAPGHYIVKIKRMNKQEELIRYFID